MRMEAAMKLKTKKSSASLTMEQISKTAVESYLAWLNKTYNADLRLESVISNGSTHSQRWRIQGYSSENEPITTLMHSNWAYSRISNLCKGMLKYKMWICYDKHNKFFRPNPSEFGRTPEELFIAFDMKNIDR